MPADRGARLADAVVGSQVDLLVFDPTPEPLDTYVVTPGTAAVPAERHSVPEQQAGEAGAGELTSPVGVENLRPAMPGKRRLDRVNSPTFACRACRSTVGAASLAMCQTRTLPQQRQANAPATPPSDWGERHIAAPAQPAFSRPRWQPTPPSPGTPGCGSNVLVWSALLLIRSILTALRQKIHPTACLNPPDHL